MSFFEVVVFFIFFACYDEWDYMNGIPSSLKIKFFFKTVCVFFRFYWHKVNKLAVLIDLLMPDESVFQVSFKGGKIRVQRHTIGGGTTIYYCAFTDGRPPLVMTKATGKEIGKHWTSVPEGRLDEAEEVGLIIEDYYKQS